MHRKQLIVVTLASARGMTVDDYGLALRKQWGLETNGKRVMLIVGSTRRAFGDPVRHRAEERCSAMRVTERILEQTMKPRFNAGDFPGGVVDGRERSDRRADQGAIRVRAVPCASRKTTRSRCRRRRSIRRSPGRVVDDAGVLDAATRESLRAKLAALEAKTTDQLVVATVKSLNGNSVEDYANRLFRRWQLGQRGKNNGVLLLHAPTERKIRIEVGYGLEGTLTDAITKYIIQNAITPRFKANDFAGGMTRGVDDIIKVLDGGAEEFKQRAAPRRQAGCFVRRDLHGDLRCSSSSRSRWASCSARSMRCWSGSAGRRRSRSRASGTGWTARRPRRRLVRLMVVLVGLVVELSRRFERQLLGRRRRFRRRRLLG